MGIMGKGLLGLILWLMLGFAFTEATVIGLNAWMLRASQASASQSVASNQADFRN